LRWIVLLASALPATNVAPFGICPTARYSRAGAEPSFTELIVKLTSSPGLTGPAFSTEIVLLSRSIAPDKKSLTRGRSLAISETGCPTARATTFAGVAKIRANVVLCCANATALPTSNRPKTAERIRFVFLVKRDILISFEKRIERRKNSSAVGNQRCRTSESAHLNFCLPGKV